MRVAKPMRTWRKQMAVTATLRTATPLRMTFLLAQDGQAGATLTMTNAVLQAAAAAGALKDALNAAYVTDGTSVQSAMRSVFGGGDVEMRINIRSQSAGSAASDEHQWAIDVDTDAVSTTKPEFNVAGPTSAGDAWLVVEKKHSLVK